MTIILLYAALQLTISSVHESYAWLTVLLYWFLYAPVAITTSLRLAISSGIVE